MFRRICPAESSARNVGVFYAGRTFHRRIFFCGGREFSMKEEPALFEKLLEINFFKQVFF